MKYSIKYNDRDITLHIPSKSVIISPKNIEKTDQHKVVVDGLKKPYGSVNLEKFVESQKTILIIVNDGTRPTPTAKILETIYPIIKDKIITIMIATGVHRIANENEIKKILGKTYTFFKSNLVSHEACKSEDLVFLGYSRANTPLEINKRVLENDALIVIGSVEPHYFAGYTGGRKAIMPGVASYKSIEANHKRALDPRAKVLNLSDNPVHLDMVDVLNLLEDKPIFSIMSVMDRDHKIYKITSGNINESFYAAIDGANEVFTCEIAEKSDVVVTVASSPMDINLYQAQKAIDNGKLALKKNGILILVAACNEGVGERAFYNLLKSSNTPKQVLQHIRNDYKLGYHKAAKMAEIMTWANIWVISELDNKLWNDIFIKQFSSIQDAIDKAIQIKGEKCSLSLLSDGCITVPLLNQR